MYQRAAHRQNGNTIFHLVTLYRTRTTSHIIGNLQLHTIGIKLNGLLRNGKAARPHLLTQCAKENPRIGGFQ